MVDESEGGSLDLAEVEAELCRLPDVAAVRIVADGVGRPVEVHVLAHTGKQPKQVVRDVQSVALASFGIELDRRIVSVVQLGPNGSSQPETTPTEATDARAHHVDAVAHLRSAHDRPGGARARRRRSRRLRGRHGCRFGAARVWSRSRRSTRSVSSSPAPTTSTSTARRSCAPAPTTSSSSRSSTSTRRSSTTSRAPRCCTRTRTTRTGARRARRDQPSPLAPRGATRDADVTRHPRPGPMSRPVAVFVSYRLGGTDGVSIESRKWEWALARARLRHPPGRGELDDGLRPDDTWLAFLAIDPVDGAEPQPDALGAAIAGAELVVVENLCSLPLNPVAAHLTADVLSGHPGRVVFHHHDLPWERPRFVDVLDLPPHRPDSLHVTINEGARRALTERGFDAHTVRNAFDLDEEPGDRDRDAHGARIRARRPRRAAADACDPAQERRGRPAAGRAARGALRTRRAAGALLAHRARRGRLPTRARRAARGGARAGHDRARARGRPTATRRPTSSCSRPPGRGSATR